MKKLFLISVFLSLLFLFYSHALAEVPQMINYQGKLTNDSGAPLDTTLQMIFTIYADSVGAISKWSETQTAVKVEKGMFNVLLGSVDSIPYSVFDGSIRYLEVKIGDDPEITPRKPMVSVGYAYKAFEADTADYARAGGSGIGGSGTTNYVPKFTGSITLGNSVIYETGGNIGIGTTTPNEQLEITGNLALPITTVTTGIIKVGGDRFIHSYGWGNTFVGENAGNLTMTGVWNTGNGYRALYYNTTGNYNTANGYESLNSNTTGGWNTANGCRALYDNITGYNNTANGRQALSLNTTGYNNTAIGMDALFSNTEGFRNTALGYSADVSVGNLTNATAIGYGAVVDASNKVRVGNTSVTSIGGQVGWTTFSDGRYKKSISENVPGLSFISKLKPVTFTMDVDAIDAVLRPPRKPHEGQTEEDLKPSAEDMASKQAQSQIVYTGFIAQEVEKAAKETGYDFSGVDAPKDGKGMYGLRYAEFVVPLVKAIQEQQQIIQELQKRIEELEKK
jgi:hypothetical protein